MLRSVGKGRFNLEETICWLCDLVCFTAVLGSSGNAPLHRRVMLSSRFWGGALRDDTKNGLFAFFIEGA